MKKRLFSILLMCCMMLALLSTAAFAEGEGDANPEKIMQDCETCKGETEWKILAYFPTPISSVPDPVYHWIRVQCTKCDSIKEFTPGSALGKHTGGTETPTCTTGKTCEKCGAEYGKLGHIWGDWQSNDDNKTHTHICQRDGCGAFETENCGGDGNATCVTPGTCTDCKQQYYGEHTFPATWKWWDDTDTNVGRDTEKHWVRCIYCEEGKAYESAHSFVPGNVYLKSAATCVSPAEYYTNCGTCYYKGTDTYFDPYNWLKPHDLVHYDAQETAAAGAGNAECWHCNECGKYFSDEDAENEIVISKRKSSDSDYSECTVKATAGTGGSITPDGTYTTRMGNSKNFVITPDAGYSVLDVKVDGKSVGAVTSYMFSDIDADHTIEVTFQKGGSAAAPSAPVSNPGTGAAV